MFSLELHLLIFIAICTARIHKFKLIVVNTAKNMLCFREIFLPLLFFIVLEKAGVNGFHFYTLNLERSVLAVLKDLGVESSTATRR